MIRSLHAGTSGSFERPRRDRWGALLRLLAVAPAAILALAPGLARASCDCGSTSSLAVCTGNSASLTRGPSTITFDFECSGGACRCGKFANEYDYWVAPASDGGTVKITGMTPAAEGSGSSLRHGWTSDPDNMEDWGLDGRVKGGPPGSPLNPSPSNPYSVNTGGASFVAESIFKARSLTGTGSDCRSYDSDGNKRMCFQHIELLTVLKKVPDNAGSTVLRPQYFGPEKELFSTDKINFSGLPELPPAKRGNGTPVITDWDEALSMMEAVKPDWAYTWSGSEQFAPKYNYDNIVNGYNAGPKGKMMTAMINVVFEAKGADAAKKRLLVIHTVQWGLDLLAIIEHGADPDDNHPTYGSWPPAGGYGVGRYGASLLTAVLLDDGGERAALLEELKTTGLGLQVFAESSQITPSALYGAFSVPGGRSAKGKKNEADPNDVWDGILGECPADYQSITYPSMWAAANIIRLIPRARDTAYAPFMQYVDRMQHHGMYCADPDKDGKKPFGLCTSGTDVGLVCLGSNDCQSGDCDRPGINFRSALYNSWPSMNAWFAYDSCWADTSCPGQEHLLEGEPQTSSVQPPTMHP